MVTNINDVSWGTRGGGGGKPKKKLTFKEALQYFEQVLKNFLLKVQGKNIVGLWFGSQ